MVKLTQKRAAKLVIIPSNLLFGVQNVRVQIRGFAIVERSDCWLIARQSGKEFLVEDFPRGYRLTPFRYMPIIGEKCALTDRALWVPKDRPSFIS
jgi:hypothetical protein